MNRSSVRREAGIGLVELMIGLTLGLLLMAGVFQVYLGTKHNYRIQESVLARQSAARFALMILTEDLQMAGFRGCVRDPALVNNTLNDPYGFLYDFSVGVEGFAAQGAGWSPMLPPSITNAVPGTDVLAVRTVDDPGIFITQSMPTPSAVLRVNDNLNPPPISIGDILLVTDCGAAAIFQVTNFTVANGNIVHNAGVGSGLPVPGNATQNLGRRYPEGSQIFRMRTTSFYIAPSTNGTGPALWRRTGLQAPQELAEGIENLQVRFGEDISGDAVPDVWRKADSVGFWDNVVAVRLALLVAGTGRAIIEQDGRVFTLLDEEVGPFADGRLRQVITTTISLRNQLP